MNADVSRQTYPFSLPDLPYAYDALEPHIDGKTLRIHHREHHGTYVKKLNEALAGDTALQQLTLAELLRDVDKLPEAIRTAVKNNGGGHLNHDLFWQLDDARTRRAQPRGALAEALGRDFGSFEAFPHEIQRGRRQTFRERLGGTRARARQRRNWRSSISRITKCCARATRRRCSSSTSGNTRTT